MDINIISLLYKMRVLLLDTMTHIIILHHICIPRRIMFSYACRHNDEKWKKSAAACGKKLVLKRGRGKRHESTAPLIIIIAVSICVYVIDET